MRTYGKIQLDEAKKFWILKTEPHVAIRLKAVFPRIPKASDVYRFTNNPDVCLDLDWFMSRYPLEISDHDRAIMSGSKDLEIAKRLELERIIMPDYQAKKYALRDGLALRHYQAQAVDIFLKNKALLIGDVVGLGKTLCGIGSATVPHLLPMLVVVQTHLPKQWEDQFDKFIGLRVHKIKGTRPYSLPAADVYIIKYSCIAGWTPTYESGWFKSAVFDEIQELRRPDSDKYRAAKIICRNAEYKMGLSATPVYNYGDEMFNIIDLLAEGMLGQKDDFIREWCKDDRQVEDPNALGAFLKENFLFLRRTRQEVGRELPPVSKLVHEVEYDEEEVEKMENLAKTLAIKVTTGSFIERGQASRELDIMVRQATGVSKAKYVAEYVKILLDGGESVLLAGWHRAVYDIWAKELADYKPVWYTGTESANQKELSKQAFISGESNLMIISLRSGIGLDGLQSRGKIVVFGELDWSPATHDQVIGRLARDGQLDPVTAIFLVSNSGSDPLMVELNGLKASQASGIIDPFKGVEQVHSDDSRIKLLAESFLNKQGR